MNLAFKISSLSFLGLLLGFINQLVIASFFGADIHRDIFFASFSITNYIFLVINGSFLAIFLSYYIKLFETEGEVASSKLVLQVSLFLLTLLLIIIWSFFLTEFQFLKILFPKYQGSNFELLKKMIIVQLFSMLLQTLGTLFSMLFQVKGRFFIFTLFALLTTVANTTLVLLLSKSLGIMALPISSLISYTCAGAFLLIKFQKLGVKFDLRIVFAGNRKNFLNFLRISFPLFVSGIVFRFNAVFERYLTSQLPEGSVSYLGYANQILAMIATLVTTGLAVLIVPEMARDWNRNNKEKLEKDLSDSIKLIVLFLGFICVVMLSSGNVFIQILFERGKFDHNATLGVSLAFNYLLGALIFQSLGNIVVKVLYLTEKSWIASLIGLVEIIIYMVISLFLVKIITYRGVALATSISSGINILLTLFYIRKKGINLLSSKNIIFICKIFFCGLSVYGVIYILEPLFFLLPLLIKGGLILVISLGIYILLLYLLKINEAINLINRIYLSITTKYANRKKC